MESGTENLLEGKGKTAYEIQDTSTAGVQQSEQIKDRPRIQMCKQDMNPLRNHPYTTGRPRASRPKCEQQKKPLRIYSQETSCIQTKVRRRNDTSGNLHPWGLVHPDRLSKEPSHARMFSCRKIKFKTIPRRRYHKRYDDDTAPYAT